MTQKRKIGGSRSLNGARGTRIRPLPLDSGVSPAYDALIAKARECREVAKRLQAEVDEFEHRAGMLEEAAEDVALIFQEFKRRSA